MRYTITMEDKETGVYFKGSAKDMADAFTMAKDVMDAAYAMVKASRPPSYLKEDTE